MTIEGSVDGFIPPNTITGWARTTSRDTVMVRVLRAGKCVGEATADTFRKDLNDNAGFRIEVTEEIDPMELGAGGFLVSASIRGGAESSLRVWEGLLRRLFPLALDYRAKRLSNDDWAEFLKLALQYGDARSRERLESLVVRPASKHVYIDAPDIPPGELSSFGLEPGLSSPSGVATVGRNGYLFITGGGNNLLEQYRQNPKDEAARTISDAWIELFRRRRAALVARRIRYVQLVIPEKSSVLPDSYPVKIAAPTPLSASVCNAIRADPDLAISFCDVLQILAEHPQRPDLFRRLDSHLSPFGCSEVFRTLLAHVGWTIHPLVPFTESTVWGGDLVEHFPGLPLREVVRLPEKHRVIELEKGLTQTALHFPGYHNGMYATWTNADAPAPLRVVAFANSFFGIGDSSSLLSWWAARWFKEFHFRWSPDFDYEYIDRVQPDLVIGQTVERFLPVVPSN